VELVHLECFVTLADELHFGRGAARLGMGTPAMSRRIGELERALGIRLFDRTSRDVRITPAGEIILGQAKVALSEVGVFRAMAANAASGAVGGIRAAYSPGTGELMTVLTRGLRSRSPGMVVHAEQMISVRVAGAVRSKAVTVGIARIAPGPDLATMVLAESALSVVALPATHRLALRAQVYPTDLADETIVRPARSLGVSDAALPSTRLREAHVTSEGELFDLVSAGFGLHITTEGAFRRNPRQDLVARPLVGFNRSNRAFLLWRPDDESAVVRAVMEVAEEARPEMLRIMLG
jgi:DNA-binding transcriptional LysR family regulator